MIKLKNNKNQNIYNTQYQNLKNKKNQIQFHYLIGVLIKKD